MTFRRMVEQSLERWGAGKTELEPVSVVLREIESRTWPPSVQLIAAVVAGERHENTGGRFLPGIYIVTDAGLYAMLVDAVPSFRHWYLDLEDISSAYPARDDGSVTVFSAACTFDLWLYGGCRQYSWLFAKTIRAAVRARVTNPQPATQTGTIGGDLSVLADLHKTGTLSDEEFAAAKRRILGEQ